MNSFIENVNYVAGLDNRYGSVIELYKNNLSLKSVQHDIELKFSYYNNDDKKIHSIVYSEPGVLVGEINDTLLSFKTLVESSITGSEFTCTVNFVINNISIVNINIVSNNNTYKTYELEMKVVTAGVVTYDVFGEVKDSLKILPSLAMIAASDIDAMVNVYEIQEEVTTVSENIVNVETVSDSIANVNTVGISISNVNIVGEDIANVNTVSTHISNVDTVSQSITNVNTVSSNIVDLGIASTNIASINTVANAQNLADIIRVADDLNSLDVNGIADITIVANDLVLGVDSNIITVSESIDNVNITGNDIDNINIVGTDIANVDIVSTNIANVNITATDISSVNNVSSSIAEVNTVSDGITNVNIVSGSIANVNTVASNIVGLNSIVSNMTEISLADNNAAIATTKATEAISSATSAFASKNAASTSETNALASKNSASTSEANALAYKNAAATSATNSDTSATSALASKNAASTSATSASGSAATATTKASEASTSATSAATSATASATSATNSANSATDAASSAALALEYKESINPSIFNLKISTQQFDKPTRGPLFVKVSPSSIKIPAGLKITVGTESFKVLTDYTLTLASNLVGSTKTAGTDYYVYAKSNSTFYISANDAITTDRLIGGFHYGLVGETETVTGNKLEADMVKIRGINQYSFWDLKYRPVASPKGMVKIGSEWYDIYLLNSEHITNGTSKAGLTIAGGTTDYDRAIPKIPLEYGGNNTLNYGKFTWFQACEIAKANAKRLISYSEFPTITYGVLEGVSSSTNSYETVAGKIEHYPNLTSKFGIEQATGVQNICGDDLMNGYGTTSFASNTTSTDSRGSINATANSPTAVLLGGSRSDGVYSGSRASSWVSFVWNSNWNIGCRFTCDHLELV